MRRDNETSTLRDEEPRPLLDQVHRFCTQIALLLHGGPTLRARTTDSEISAGRSEGVDQATARRADLDGHWFTELASSIPDLKTKSHRE
jgi:hypothetical protein